MDTTEIINNDSKDSNVLNTFLNFVSKAKGRIDACVDHTRPALAVNIARIRNSILDAKRRGVRIRCITEITKGNLSYCTELITIVDELRHLDGIRGNFYTNDIECILPVAISGEGIATQIIYSNKEDIVKQEQYTFDSFWAKTIPAEQKFREIEEGKETEFVEVTSDTARAPEIIGEISTSIEKEALSLVPSAKGMLRMDRLGVLDNLIKASQRGALVKIMCPIVEENCKIAKRISDRAPSIQIMNINDNPADLLIVDNKKLFQAEVKEPKAGQFTAAIGFAIYSNSKHNVNSFKSFYELLWNQAELYERSKKELAYTKDELADMKKYLNEVLEEVKELKANHT